MNDGQYVGTGDKFQRGSEPLTQPRALPPRSGMKRRVLPAQEAGPALELYEVGGRDGAGKAPVLCLHGAFGGAWMWTEFFLPALGGLGRSAAALSLRGHGGSEGREALGRATLADYTADVLRAFDALAEPPIVVAHSLGALLAQRLLGCRPMRALVLLAPLPPEGMLFVTPRLLVTAPKVWLEILDVISGNHGIALAHTRDTVFSSQLAPEDVDRYLSLMVPEGHCVLLECHVPLAVLPAFVLGVPTLIVAGSKDPLVPPDAAFRTALYHGADRRLVDGAGHLIHLESMAEGIAQDVVEWLEAREL